jgi:hypothetical protein
VVDPTANVYALVEAETKRQNDLREALELRIADGGQHIRELLALDRAHAAEIRDLETKRLDAIRAVDQAQIQRAAEVQATAALALQAQVVTSAETVRTQQATFAQSFTDALTNAIKPLADTLAIVQQQQNLQAGELAGQRIQVAESRDTRGDWRGNIGTLVAVAVALLALGTAFFAK